MRIVDPRVVNPSLSHFTNLLTFKDLNPFNGISLPIIREKNKTPSGVVKFVLSIDVISINQTEIFSRAVVCFYHYANLFVSNLTISLLSFFFLKKNIDLLHAINILEPYSDLNLRVVRHNGGELKKEGNRALPKRKGCGFC